MQHDLKQRTRGNSWIAPHKPKHNWYPASACRAMLFSGYQLILASDRAGCEAPFSQTARQKPKWKPVERLRLDSNPQPLLTITCVSSTVNCDVHHTGKLTIEILLPLCCGLWNRSHLLTLNPQMSLFHYKKHHSRFFPSFVTWKPTSIHQAT
jgi:hypothetical protein